MTALEGNAIWDAATDLPGARSTRLPYDLASQAYGLLTAAQLRGHGLGRSAIEHAVRRGDLLRIARGLFVVAGAPDAVERRALAATLRFGGSLSHRTAPAWWGIGGFRIEPLHVVRYRPGSTEPSDLAVLHRPVRLREEHLTTWRGVPVTRPTRTLFDLAATTDPLLVERTYDTMWSRGLVTNQSMAEMLADLEGRGRPGIQLMRRLIEARQDLAQPTGSRLERRFEHLVERAGIPPMRRQVDVGDDEAWIGRVDFVGSTRRLVVEIDSSIHHAALLDARHDRDRTARLEAAGWHVQRWTEDEVWHEGARVVRELRTAYWRAPRVDG
ncbi:MAG: DUF559 domain-containing protein [Microthrixaceae bacterium]